MFGFMVHLLEKALKLFSSVVLKIANMKMVSASNFELRLFSETDCPALVSQLVNSSSTHIYTVVNVSCPDGQTLSVGPPVTSLVSVCDKFGRWQPSIPECIGVFVISHMLVAIESRGVLGVDSRVLHTDSDSFKKKCIDL